MANHTMVITVASINNKKDIFMKFNMNCPWMISDMLLNLFCFYIFVLSNLTSKCFQDFGSYTRIHNILLYMMYIHYR